MLSEPALRFLRLVKEAQKHRKGRKGRPLCEMLALHNIMLTRMSEHHESPNKAAAARANRRVRIGNRYVVLSYPRWRQLYAEVSASKAGADQMLGGNF